MDKSPTDSFCSRVKDEKNDMFDPFFSYILILSPSMMETGAFVNIPSIDQPCAF
jgi:hypothetical protein